MEPTRQESTTKTQSRKGGVRERLIFVSQIFAIILGLRLSDGNTWMLLVYAILSGTYYLEGFLDADKNAS